MKEKGNFLKILRLFHCSEDGFSFLELMVVLTILGSLAGLATLGIVRFIGGATEEVRAVEEHQVQRGAVVYLASGNTISEPFTVTPSDQGVLDPYLMGNLKNSWVIDVDGNVTYAGSRGESGERRK
ncbi:MAG: type II secretion system protein [Chloroflexi bacterium]|nr:type II secretion system protein [Chloroflexota bacterium]MBL7061958.1 type II secretion system protein [Dehalococcoidia bacterium]